MGLISMEMKFATICTPDTKYDSKDALLFKKIP